MSFRKCLSLDGIWQFYHDPEQRAELNPVAPQAWRVATVPLPWQAQFEDLREAAGAGWYRRRFALPNKPEGSAILHFGAADYHTRVWINGRLVGEHEGGYLPFEFEVAPYLQPGVNELLVRVADEAVPHREPTPYPFAEIPHGKQSWYGPISGLWQSVWLEQRSAVHIRRLRLTPDRVSGQLTVQASLNQRPSHHDFTLEITVLDPTGRAVARRELHNELEGTLTLDLETLRPWSPDDPALYTVLARLAVAGEPVDLLQETCGFRTVEARDGRIFLNGEPIYLRGALDQAYYPYTIYTPPSLAFLEDQVRKAKALGLNCLRCHIKIEDPRYYQVADRLGILIWTEIPNWMHLSPDAARRARETFAGMVERDWNHPSIIAWSLVNEDWGTDLVRNPEHRRWLADFYQEAKALDPTRLIVDNSPCAPNFHVAGDLEDYHHYRCIPDHAAEWDQWVADFAGRAPWAWAPDFADHRRDDLPLIVSEFGNWGLPDPRAIQENGRDPWWFETGYDWGEGIVYPHGVEQRFHKYGLDQVFGSWDDFLQASQEHMARSLAYELTSMRRHPAIAGYVITEFTDVHWECNGLMDMQRHIKAGLDRYFVDMNQERVVTVRPQRWSAAPGQSIAVELQAMGPAGPEAEGTFHWRAGAAQGTAPAPAATVEVPVPRGLESQILPLHVTWRDGQGLTRAQALVELAVVAAPAPVHSIHVVDDEALAQALQELGYSLVEQPSPGEGIWVARRYTPALQEAVQAGARLLLLAEPEEPTAPGLRLPAGRVVPRAGTAWQGDWATSFSWLRKTGPFAHLPGGPLLEMEFQPVTPRAVLAGLPATLMAQATWAGLALGWIHRPVSLLHRLPYGRGAVTMTTFHLPAETIREDALAQGLFVGLTTLAGM
ncbi:hypothetical protein FKZ61_021845 [Litorilinea aerophila]|nr:sugar-binding domain-containing protein [Litorilinea aerophila]MCC9078743.1 hypothetical protein [Litorilinea aerophila]